MFSQEVSFPIILEDSLMAKTLHQRLKLRLNIDAIFLGFCALLIAFLRDSFSFGEPLFILTGFLVTLDYARTYANLRIIEFYLASEGTRRNQDSV